MGCKVSTVNQSVSTENKNMALNIWDPTEANPKIPLTMTQKINIVKSWKGISRNIEQTGLLMFLRLFEDNREVRTMFANIKATTKYSNRSLRDSLGDHIKVVMYVLSETMASLEDGDAVIQNLHHVGQIHRRLKNAGFDPTIFWKIEEPFLMAVKETLGKDYTPTMANIYRKAIQFIISTLIEGFNEVPPGTEHEIEAP